MSSTLADFLKDAKKRIKRKQEPAEKKGGFTMRPLKFLARKVATERNFVPFTTDVVTKGLLDDMRFAFEHHWNITCVFIGGPGEGKSRGVWKLANIWTLMTHGQFEYCWDVDEIPDVIDGSWVHIDEYLIPEGPGKFLALQRLKNLFDTARALMNCISVSTPTAPNTPFSTFEATTLAQDFDNRRNLFEIRVHLPRFGMVYIGNAIIPIGKDDDKWLQYEAESYARKTGVWDSKGKKTIAPKFDAQKLAQEVIAWAKEQNVTISSRDVARTIVRKLAKERKWDTDYASEPDIITWVMLNGKTNGTNDNSQQKGYGEYSTTWNGLREYINSWCLRHKPPRKEYAEATAMWIVPDDPPLSQDDVFELIDFGESPVKAASLAREIRALRRRVQHPDRDFTDFTESWLASQLVNLGARKLGGQDKPDIMLPDGRQIAVKFCIRNDPFYDYTVAPETDGLVVIIIPRRLQFFVIPIKNNVINEHLQLDNQQIRRDGLLVGIDELSKTIKDMLSIDVIPLKTTSQSEDPETAVFMEAVISLAHLSGLEAVEKTLQEKGMKESTIKATLQYVQQELERRGLKK